MNQSTLQRIVKEMNLIPIDDDYRTKRLIEHGIVIDSKYEYRSECDNQIYSPEFLLSKYEVRNK